MENLRLFTSGCLLHNTFQYGRLWYMIETRIVHYCTKCLQVTDSYSVADGPIVGYYPHADFVWSNHALKYHTFECFGNRSLLCVFNFFIGKLPPSDRRNVITFH